MDLKVASAGLRSVIAELEASAANGTTAPADASASASSAAESASAAASAGSGADGGSSVAAGGAGATGESKSSGTSLGSPLASPAGAGAAAGVRAPPDTDKFARLVDWLVQGGAKFPKLYLKYYTEGFRGVHAATHIAPNTMVLYIPQNYIITSELARASEIGCRITESQVVLRSKHSYLAAYLLQERDKGAASFWSPYIDILPKSFDNVPLFFRERELGWLEGSFTRSKIADRLESLQAEYDALRRALPEFNQWRFEEFVWARLAVITRIFGLVIDGLKTDGMVPYADMLNHRLPRETRWMFDDSCTGFTITSIPAIQRGEQVFDSYGRKCNNRFFINYGFTVRDNPDNEAVIRVEIPAQDPQLNWKLRALIGSTDPRREYQVPIGYSDTKSFELFAFMRLSVATEDEIPAASRAMARVEMRGAPVSLRNERAALAALAAAARNMLRGYPQTLEEDNARLASGELREYSNEWNAVVMRSGEKAVLQWFVDLEARCAPLLFVSREIVKKLIARSQQHQKTITVTSAVAEAADAALDAAAAGTKGSNAVKKMPVAMSDISPATSGAAPAPVSVPMTEGDDDLPATESDATTPAAVAAEDEHREEGEATPVAEIQEAAAAGADITTPLTQMMWNYLELVLDGSD